MGYQDYSHYTMAEGRCNCAGITVSIPEMPKESAICYWYGYKIYNMIHFDTNRISSNCRRAGSCVGSIIFVMAKDEVHITDPKEQLKTYEDHDTQTGHTVIRQFCGGCGR